MRGNILKLLVIAPLAVWGVWSALTLNLADHYVSLNAPEAGRAALSWRRDQPDALVSLLDLRTTEDGVRDIVAPLLKSNPTDSRAMAVLGRYFDQTKQSGLAQQALSLADRLSPQRTDVQSILVNFWLVKGDFSKALTHMSKLMTNNPDAARDYFPLLLNYSEQNASLAAFRGQPVVSTAWWPAFFNYAAVNAVNTATVRALYALHPGAEALDASVHTSYLSRLQRDGAWMEAYFAWLNRLGKDDLGQLANIYNGGFERPPSGVGFDWITARTHNVSITPASTYGVIGDRALRLSFNGQRVPGNLIHQFTVLAPGNYSMRGRIRADGLKISRGLEWTLTCVGTATPLAVSERFAGSDQWRFFTLQFAIPDVGCQGQDLSLRVAASVPLDYQVDGVAWFDDLIIQSVD